MLIKSLVISFCIFFYTCAFASLPTIDNGKLVFLNGLIIPLGKNIVLFENKNVALEKKLPVKYSKSALIIPEWDRVLFIRDEFYFEGKVTELTIFSFNGVPELPALKFSGDYFLLKNKSTFLIVDSNKYIYFMNKSGGLLSKVTFNEIYDIGKSKDEEIIWVFSFVIINEEIFTEVNIFSYEGKQIDKLYFKNMVQFPFSYNNNKYLINIPKPDYPG